MPSLIDLTDQRFGKLTVIKRDINHKGSYWICKCDCGNIKSINSASLRKGYTTTCGCLKKPNLIGERFNYLTVIDKVEDGSGHQKWLCRCKCGNTTIVNTGDLRRGKIKSCGCLLKEHIHNKLYRDLTGQRFGKLTVLRDTGERRNNSVLWECVCDCGNKCNINSSNLIQGNTQSCGCLRSQGEYFIQKILEENNIIYEKEKIFNDLIHPQSRAHLRYDFYLPDYKRLIEFDGRQHYDDSGQFYNTKDHLQRTQERDKIKNEYALSHNIDLVRIPYWQKNNITLNMILGDKYLIAKTSL